MERGEVIENAWNENFFRYCVNECRCFLERILY
jgi:hypothetical protein